MFQFRDISIERQDVYALGENERAVFFMLNRTGDIVFRLAGPRAEAHIFAFFSGDGQDEAKLSLTQLHEARETVSSASVRSVLRGEAAFTYEGLIRIERPASGSKANQESRSLLLSRDAKAFTKPSLEILPEDVECRHAATVSPLSQEALFFLRSRGLSPTQAEEALVAGFFKEPLAQMKALGIAESTIGACMNKIA